MQKVLFVGPDDKRDALLSSLQKAGVLQIEEYKGSVYESGDSMVDTGFSEKIHQSWKVLAHHSAEIEELPHHKKGRNDISVIVNEILESESQIQALKDEEKELEVKINQLFPWGEFDHGIITRLEALSQTAIQFWEASEKNISEISFEDSSKVIMVNEYNRKFYFITLSPSALIIPEAIEQKIEHSIKQLRLALVKNQRIQCEIISSIADFAMYKRDLYELYLSELNTINYKKALGAMVNPLDGMLFALQGWSAKESLAELKKISNEQGIELLEIEPDVKEKVPTKLKNSGLAEMGEDLVMFYDTPSSKEWDPSTWIFLSFILFFSMIMGDAGYGITLFAILLFMRIKHRRAGRSALRFMNMAMVLTFGTFIYGMLFGGFYGINLFISEQLPLPEQVKPVVNWLNSFKALGDSQKNAAFMRVSVLIGLGHISFSLFLKALRDFSVKQFLRPFSNFAWIMIMWTFYLWYSTGGETAALSGNYGYIMGTCLGIVFLTSAGTLQPGKLVAGGLMGIYNGVQFFSDVLSYIRIFALGLSGSLIAIVFNDLAFKVMAIDIPVAVGIPLGVLVLVFGHLLNIGLCLMGAVIHGLRLNFLEYYRWSFDGDGRPFKPFEDLLIKK